MKWTKLTLSTMADAVDLVSNMLSELGIEGIEIIDNVPITENEKKAMFIDILPELNTEDKTALISFYLEENEDIQDMVVKIKSGLKELSEFMDIGSGLIEISETEDLDWINNWKAYFKPFRIDDTIVIKPTWEKLDNVKDTDLVIEIDPGTAFGTGSHETTKLCILGIKKYIKDEIRLLDVGCGSGILSIIGAKLGAKNVLGTDIDPNAVNAAIENAEVNHITAETLKIISGDIITDTAMQQEVGYGSYDMAVANILADIIIPLSAVIGQHIKPNGIFISSGIINTKKEQVKEAILKNGFKILEINEMGDWVSIVAQK
ncbi:50S ribosomal protein L11 methyltransferase [Anaerocolumna sedimenticola]|uniref:Ribosomal protein L11 methyltransferase n=1 Tax=Anaerocolumna sedimenticola TaxID=2696063 RepID=A0A6P1TL35_9FIRM|nr:50S ribosomal protein L11 methyltransferase [Anaerocolumna sedimenticola]QHQ61930.1 50S ribosomal protein L11 methyltransferase [Anaerocolumna sedimenticola]